ncbi:hypothetical protein EDC01DRAFT_234079 [Geopyxis carbonaria]|nr:hypothetical protein EDC01DRAFT_234079 [Geopyxis carbonaria]
MPRRRPNTDRPTNNLMAVHLLFSSLSNTASLDLPERPKRMRASMRTYSSSSISSSTSSTSSNSTSSSRTTTPTQENPDPPPPSPPPHPSSSESSNFGVFVTEEDMLNSRGVTVEYSRL